MSKELIILSGLPGSGKSTICNEYKDYEVIHLDDIRLEVTNSNYNEDLEPSVWDIARNLLIEKFNKVDKLIIDESNTNILNILFWVRIKFIIPDLNITIIKLNTDPEECKRRRNSDLFNRVIDRKLSNMTSNEELKDYCKLNNFNYIEV